MLSAAGSMRNLAKFVALAGLVLVLLVVPPLTHNDYYLHILISICVNIILAAGLLLIFTSGQLSVAHIGFMCIGSYVSAALATKLGVSFWLTLPIAGVTAGIFAVGLGYLTLRLRGLYFILVSFSFAAIVALFFGNLFENTFGGNIGLTNIPPPNTIRIPGLVTIDFAASRVPFYYLALVLTVVTLVIIYRLNNSRVGKALRAISQAETLAEQVGLNVLGWKILAFAIGCFFAGIAGSFFAHYNYVIVAADFDFERWTTILTYMVVGGVGSAIAGPAVGACVLTVVYELLAPLPYQRAVLFGAVLIFVMVFQREGLVGLPGRIVSLTQRLNRPHPDKEEAT